MFLLHMFVPVAKIQQQQQQQQQQPPQTYARYFFVCQGTLVDNLASP